MSGASFPGRRKISSREKSHLFFDQQAAKSGAQISGSEAAEGSQRLGTQTSIGYLSISSASPFRLSDPVLGIEMILSKPGSFHPDLTGHATIFGLFFEWWPRTSIPRLK